MINISDSPLKTDAKPVLDAMSVAAFAIMTLVGTRSADTGKHILRTKYYVKTLAQRLTSHPRFAAFLTEEYLSILSQSVLMHDIGTIGIPDRILLKPSHLTPEEFEIIKTHTTLARDAIEQAEQALGCRAELLQTIKELAYSHHERWDGSGYPQGLAGDAIPIAARLMAVADVYDALISRRVYKEGMSHEKAVLIMREGRGTHFDPDMLDAFIDIQEEFRAIARRFVDSDADMDKKKDYLLQAGTAQTGTKKS